MVKGLRILAKEQVCGLKTRIYSVAMALSVQRKNSKKLTAIVLARVASRKPVISTSRHWLRGGGLEMRAGLPNIDGLTQARCPLMYESLGQEWHREWQQVSKDPERSVGEGKHWMLKSQERGSGLLVCG